MKDLFALAIQSTILKLRTGEPYSAELWLIAYHEAGMPSWPRCSATNSARLMFPICIGRGPETRCRSTPASKEYNYDELVYGSPEFAILQADVLVSLAGLEAERILGRKHRKSFDVVRACPWPKERADCVDTRSIHRVTRRLGMDQRTAWHFYRSCLEMVRQILRRTDVRIAVHDQGTALYFEARHGGVLSGLHAQRIINNAFAFVGEGRNRADLKRRRAFLDRYKLR